MAKRIEKDPFMMGDERTEEELLAQQPGAVEVVDEEMSNIEKMMNDIAGITTGEIVFWLHRATEKNKTLHGSFLTRYPKDTPMIDIMEAARDKYGGGDFVLLAKKDGVLNKKAAFTVEKVISTAIPMEKAAPPEDPFDRLSKSMEKVLVMDRAASMMDKGKAPAEVVKGQDPAMTMMLTMMQGVMAQNTALLQGIMAPKKDSGGNSDLLEAIKLGSALAGGKLPMEDGEGGGIMEMLKPLLPHIPQLIAGLMGRRPQPAVPVLNRPVNTVQPIPPPSPAPAALSPEAEHPAGVSLPPQDPRAVIMRRVVDEIKFILTLPVTPKLREHVLDYVEAYMPDVLQQAEVATPELFAAYVVSLDPAFVGHEQFFIDLHKQYMAGLDGVELEPSREPSEVTGT